MSKLSIATNYAASFLGLPYIWGGDHPMNGYDCSGLVQEILASVGLDPEGDQTAQTLYHELLKAGAIEQFAPFQTGSIFFFGKNKDSISHVAFGMSGREMIEAGGGGSKTKTTKDAIAQKAFVRIRPIDRRKDLVAALLPNYT